MTTTEERPEGNPESTSEVVIEARNLSKHYVMGTNIVKALNGVDLQIFGGEFVAIMGPSGSGKSTFMNMIGCLDRPTSGEVILRGESVGKMSDTKLAEIRNKYIGFVFQSFNLLPRTTALRNVELPLLYGGVQNKSEKAKDALDKVGLGDRITHKPNELSGGQQQRVAIARAIVNDPLFILADEPTGNLDTRTTEETLALLQELNRTGTTVVIVTHEDEVAHHCKRIVRFRDGVIEDDSYVDNPVDAREILAAMPDPSQ